jgi:hypothetical protein
VGYLGAHRHEASFHGRHGVQSRPVWLERGQRDYGRRLRPRTPPRMQPRVRTPAPPRPALACPGLHSAASCGSPVPRRRSLLGGAACPRPLAPLRRTPTRGPLRGQMGPLGPWGMQRGRFGHPSPTASSSRPASDLHAPRAALRIVLRTAGLQRATRLALIGSERGLARFVKLVQRWGCLEPGQDKRSRAPAERRSRAVRKAAQTRSLHAKPAPLNSFVCRVATRAWGVGGRESLDAVPASRVGVA